MGFTMSIPRVLLLLSVCAVYNDAFHHPILQSHVHFSHSTFPSTALTRGEFRPPTSLYGTFTYEQLREKLPSEAVISAVAQAKTEKVIASDVASRAGVSLLQARKDLTSLASLAKGDISVSPDGELMYEFPPHIRNVLASNSAKYKVVSAFEKAWPRIFWGIRMGFGVFFVSSMVLITCSLLCIIVAGASSSSSSSSNKKDKSSGHSSGHSIVNFIDWGPSPFDMFSYRRYGHYGAHTNRHAEPRNNNDLGFFESVFSYVFGDGNPNHEFEETRLRLAAQMIRGNKGAVTAEQLAPYCDPPNPDKESRSFVDESFVLPIVTQLDGDPQVTKDGDIVYTFSDLQTSTGRTNVGCSFSNSERWGAKMTSSVRKLMGVNGDSNTVPSELQEREYIFSRATGSNKFLAGCLGVFNMAGALILGNVFAKLSIPSHQLPGVVVLTRAIYPLLLLYAISFNVIPLVRSFWIGSQNNHIRRRNLARQKWLALLSNKPDTVQRKLKAAAKLASEPKIIKPDETIYDTKTTSSSDLDVEKNQKDLEEFDKLLGKDE